MISIIVAAAKNNVIGKENSLIWHLPADMKFFKEKTVGHCVITGRKNYESIPEKFRPLPNRTNIVITRQKDYSAPGAIVVHSLQEALDTARKQGENEIFIIGGAEIYAQAMGLADRIYLTRIDAEFDGDAFFPEVPEQYWKVSSRSKGIIDEKNKLAHEFVIYDKIL